MKPKYFHSIISAAAMILVSSAPGQAQGIIHSRLSNISENVSVNNTISRPFDPVGGRIAVNPLLNGSQSNLYATPPDKLPPYRTVPKRTFKKPMKREM